MRTKVTLVLIFLNVALFFFIFKFERNWRTEAASREARRRVLGPETADIRAIDVTTATTSYSLTRERDQWLLLKPLERWPANPHAVSAILNALQLLEHEASFPVADLARNQQSIADFGLEKPRLTLEFSSGAPTGDTLRRTTLRIGDATPDGKRLYVLSPDGSRIHVVGRILADTLTLPPEQLRSDTLFATRVFETKSLHVQLAPRSATEPGVRVRIRRDGPRWTFDAPISARASRTALELAINELNALRAKSFPVSTSSPANAPSLRIALEGNNLLETLYLGDPVPPSPGAGAGGSTEFFAQLEGRKALFTVELPATLLETLRTAQESLREKRFLEFDPAAVTAIEIASPLQPNSPPFELKRLVDPAAAPQAAPTVPSWQIVRRGDPASGPRTFPADPALLKRLLDQLAALSAEKFTSDAPASTDLEEWGFNRPIREVSLTLAGTPTPVVLRLGTDARRIAYARVGTPSEPGTSIYQVSRTILDELSLLPVAWRDRAVLPPLPANARISALKLTDLSSSKPIFETTFSSSGEPASPPSDPRALAALVSGLRILRARDYLPGGFSDRIVAAGDERPWRHQLDVSIAVPGGPGAEQTSTTSLFLTERLGGSLQYAGLKEIDSVFSLEQPLIDALWGLVYGSRDPGAPSEPRTP